MVAYNAGLRVQLHHVLGADVGIRAKRQKFQPCGVRFFQEPKFSSESKRVLGLDADAAFVVLPMASAVVLAKVS